MKTVYKYPLPPLNDTKRYSIPLAARVVLVGPDPGGVPCFWCELDTDLEKSTVSVSVIGTGRPAQYGDRHMGSFVHGGFVWHVYSMDLIKML